MYYYINSSGQQAGPVPANQLAANGVTGETLVWKAGMSQWTKAAEVAELQFMFGTQRPYQPQNQGYQPQQNTGTVQRKPDNHMVMAVICTICCCLPLGAYSIYCAAQVDGAFRGGQYDKAEEWAQKAKKWATWGFVGGAIVNILYMLIYGAELFSQFS